MFFQVHFCLCVKVKESPCKFCCSEATKAMEHKSLTQHCLSQHSAASAVFLSLNGAEVTNEGGSEEGKDLEASVRWIDREGGLSSVPSVAVTRPWNDGLWESSHLLAFLQCLDFHSYTCG